MVLAKSRHFHLASKLVKSGTVFRLRLTNLKMRLCFTWRRESVVGLLVTLFACLWFLVTVTASCYAHNVKRMNILNISFPFMRRRSKNRKKIRNMRGKKETRGNNWFWPICRNRKNEKFFRVARTKLKLDAFYNSRCKLNP